MLLYREWTKLKALRRPQKIIKSLKDEGKTTGLVIGCFDVLHLGHIRLFRDAKKRVDFLVVGLENDKSIRLTKGKSSPLNKFRGRSEILSELVSVDLIFKIKNVVKHSNKGAVAVYDKIVMELKPHFFITNPAADKYWKSKKKNAKKAGVKLLLLKREPLDSSSRIIQKLETEL